MMAVLWVLTKLIATCCVVLYTALYLNRDSVYLKIKAYLSQRFGIRSVDELSVSYDDNLEKWVVHAIGVDIQPLSSQPYGISTSHPSPYIVQLKNWIRPHLPSIRYMAEAALDLPLLLLMWLLARRVAIHVDRVHFQKGELHLKIDHILLQFGLHTTGKHRLIREKTFAIKLQMGPAMATDQDNNLLMEMSTACLITVPCRFAAGRLEIADVGVDIQLGKVKLDANVCFDYIKRQREHTNKDSNADNAKTTALQADNKISSVCVALQKLELQYQLPTTVEVSAEINRIQVQALSIERNSIPSLHFNTETISVYLSDHRLIHALSFEITASLPASESKQTQQPAEILPHAINTINLMSITWIINTPVLTIPFHSQVFVSTIAYASSLRSYDNTQPTDTSITQKRISNLPACTLAIVLNSARMQLMNIDGHCGYASSKSLIVRLSGEYLKKSSSSNGSFDDVPSSSSSSSSSRFDSLFVREEYKWLNSSDSFSNLNASRNRHSMHEFGGSTASNSRQQNAASRWLHLLGRVSRRHQYVSTIQTQSKHQLWTYRLSAKVIMKHISVGCRESNQQYDQNREFVRLKYAVFILKSGMNVVQDQVVLSAGNLIQSEAAIDRPTIVVWDTHQSTVSSASLFWLISVPLAVRSLLDVASSSNSNGSKQKVVVSGKVPLWLQNISFTLDVTQGSIVAYSEDICHTQVVNVPSGCIDNTPNSTVYTRMIMDTQKFTFTCEGPAASMAHLNEWKARCHVEKLYIHQSSSTTKGADLLKKPEKQHVILWISQLNFTTKVLQEQVMRMIITVKVKKFGISYSIRNHYTLLLLARSLGVMKAQLSNRKVKEEENPPVLSPMLIHLDLCIGRGDVRIGLPNDVHIYLRLDTIETKYAPSDLAAVTVRNIMLLGVSPTQKEKWTQLIEVDSVKIAKTDTGIELKANKILATVPYKYVLARVIENVIGLVKAIKELHSRILQVGPVFTYFGPSIKNTPILIPTIKLRTKVLTIQFDDDPFEAKLRVILRTGLKEQQRRLAYQDALDEKVNEMLRPYGVPESAPSSLPPSIYGGQPSSDESIQTMHRDPSLDSIHVEIDEARKNLLSYHSNFWIKHINQAIAEEVKFFEDLHIQHDYRNSLTAETIDRALDDGDSRRHDQFLLSKTFTIDILPRPCCPPLANFSAEYTKVSFRPTDFNLDETRFFMHNIGGGVPLNNDFSIIIPFHLSIKAGQTWIKVRDYPLPLLYVPPNGKRNNRVAWTLEGDYVAGDEVGNSGGSRIIPIPIIPNGYCLSAVRTASPLKFYSVIDYQVLATDMSMICWSISYTPAVQDILRVLETLTVPQVDPSPRIGFWDKIRFMIHTRVKISFLGDGGRLACVVKGTRDPYQLRERGAGLAKVWSDQVTWLLGYQNAQNEFMQIISQDYAFGVPDLVRGGYAPQLPGSLPQKQEKEYGSDEYHTFQKVALQLSGGVRMGIGMSFECLSCPTTCNGCQNKHRIDQCRSQTFMPHYNVLFQSLQHVDMHHNRNTYDAFRGFRSDFVHLSFSIVKLQESSEKQDSPDFSKDDPYFDRTGSISQNAMYLSPCFVEHFLQWYRLFGSPVSIPIRQGALFPSAESKPPSFGDFLDTIKYKIVINPLAIGLLYSDHETYLGMKGAGSAGLKARVNTFSVDLHQRKETLNNDQLSKTSSVFHEVEVELSDIDLRVIRARHRRKSAPSAASTTISDDEYYNDAASYDQDRNYSFQWVDPKDFVILDPVNQQVLLSRSKVDVYPFVFSPLFCYIKQNDEYGTEKREYLRKTHECIMGKGSNSHEFQLAHLHQRASELDKVIENHDKQLDIIINAINVYRNEREDLTDEHDLLVKKLEYLRAKRYMLHTYIGQLVLETELNMTAADASRDSPLTSTSSICRRDELSRWEMLMGHFKDRYFIHNPQIIWNNSVRDALYYWRTIKTHRNVQDYNLTARCLKFLQDLVDVEKQQQWKPDAPSSVPSSSQSPSPAKPCDADALIDKLLSERSDNFVAYNEKEEDKLKYSKEGNPHNGTNGCSGIRDLGDNDNNENVNDPDYQFENIPDCYEMKSDFLVDMINPQVVFQSEKGLNHLVLLTNERIHIKAFDIMDNSNSETADRDVRLVKRRIITSLDNAQVLVARKVEEVHSYHLLAQNCYGQFQDHHWAVWAQPEQLWYYRDLKHFENFERIVTQLSGTMQFDYYNHLRIKIDKYNNSSRKSPFEDRTNTMHLHFPQFKLVLDSLQGHIMYYTVMDLLLGNDRSIREKARMERFRDVMLAAERSDLAETVKQVGVLQSRSRLLLDLHKRFLPHLSSLDSVGLREFGKNKIRMHESLEKLYFVVEAIRSIQTFRRDIHLEEADNATRFIFTSNEIVWEAVMSNEAQSSLCEWKIINTKYVFLDKPNGSHKSTVEVDRFHIRNTTQSPVFTDVLDAYVDPGSPVEANYTRRKMLSGVLDSLPPVGGIPVIQHLEINLLPIHLQLSTAFGSAMKDYFFPRTLNNIPQTWQEEEISTEEEDEESDTDEGTEDPVDDVEGLIVGSMSSDAQVLQASSSSVRSFGKREGSFVSFDTIAKKMKQTFQKKRKGKADELTVMKTRSSTNRTFIYVRIPAAKHCLSLQGPNQNTFYNLYNFPFKQPKLEYRNKTWSMAEMVEEIQKQFLRAVFRHSPALLKKKLLANNKQQANNTVQPSTIAIASSVGVNKSSTKISPIIASPSASGMDLMNDSVIYNEADAEEDNVSCYTEDEDDEDDNDVKSLYSNDPEDEIQRLAELQISENRGSRNVDQELANMYMKTYSHEEKKQDELTEKAKDLFGKDFPRRRLSDIQINKK